MLQRQMMYKQLQEMQRKQQLQDLGNNRNQNCVNQLSEGQYSPTHNEIPVQDSSRMFMLGNIQHVEPNGPVLSQNHNLSPQFDMSSYDTDAPNSDDNLNRYSQLQGTSNLLVNPLAKNQPAFGSSFLSRHNFSTDHVSNPKSNLFGELPAEDFNIGFLSANYSQQGLQIKGSFSESEKGNENAASLDPLEQKILYNTDDNSWESAFSRVGKMKSGIFESKLEMPSLQSGSWSALMQSAVAETSSSDAGIQEEWSGLSFQNPEPSTDTEKLQSDWVDRNLQKDLSPSSKPENLFQNKNSFTNFQLSTLHTKQFEEYRPESSHATMQHSPRNKKHFVDNKPQQLFQGSLPLANLWPAEQKETSNNDAHHPNIFPCANDNLPSNDFSDHEFGGSFWLRGRSSGHVSCMQNKYDQVNQMKNDRYSVEPENMAHVGFSTGESLTAPSETMFELLNKDDSAHDQTPAMQQSSKVQIHRELPNTLDLGFRMGPTVHRQTPQSHSFSPSFSGSSSATSPHIMSDYMKNMNPQSVSNPRTTQFPVYGAVAPRGYSELKISNSSGSEFPVLESMPESKPSLAPDMLQPGYPIGLPTPWTENHNSFRHQYQQPEKGKSAQEGSVEIDSSTSRSRNTYHLEANAFESNSLLTNQQNEALNQGEGKKGTPSFHARDIRDFRHSLKQNYSPLPQPLSTRNAEADFVNNQISIANARKLISGDQSGVKGSQLDAFQSGNASSMTYNQNPQQPDTSSLIYKSHIRPQMVPSWFKHNETMNGQILPMYDASAPANAAQSFGEVTLPNLRESSLITQVNVTNASEIGGVCLSTAATSMACKQVNSPYAFPSDATHGNLAVSVPKKRKIAALDMVPWHKEVTEVGWRLQHISTAEYLWAEASNRKPEEAINEAENVEGLFPVTRAKRRLVSSTQLMQQVFRPLPVFLLRSDATPNCDSVPYFAARLALGEACSNTGQLPSETNNMTPDEIKTSKRTKACKYSKVAEAFMNRVKKVESDLSRLDQSSSFVDIKMETRELEKISIINRFAMFHVRTNPVNRDSPSSSISTPLRRNIQKYVVPVPVPEIVPVGVDCVSL